MLPLPCIFEDGGGGGNRTPVQEVSRVGSYNLSKPLTPPKCLAHIIRPKRLEILSDMLGEFLLILL